MIKEIFFYILAVIIFFIGTILFLYFKDIYQISSYSLILLYIGLIGLTFILERKFFGNDKFFFYFFIIQSLLLILFVKFQFKYLKNEKSYSNVTIQEKLVFPSEEQKKQYLKETIEGKIVILKEMGLSKEQAYKRLENNTDFRTLIKNGTDKYYLIYDHSKENNEKNQNSNN